MKAKRVVATDVILMKHHLTALRLPTVKAECEQVARQCAEEAIGLYGPTRTRPAGCAATLPMGGA